MVVLLLWSLKLVQSSLPLSSFLLCQAFVSRPPPTYKLYIYCTSRREHCRFVVGMGRFTFLVQVVCLLFSTAGSGCDAWSAGSLSSKNHDGVPVGGGRVPPPPPTTTVTTATPNCRTHRTFPEWTTAASAAAAATTMFVLQGPMVLAANAMDGGSSNIPTTLTTSAVGTEVGVLQIPLLAGYCAVALWALPKAAKSLRKDFPSDQEPRK